jgi:hypothetical protein
LQQCAGITTHRSYAVGICVESDFGRTATVKLITSGATSMSVAIEYAFRNSQKPADFAEM